MRDGKQKGMTEEAGGAAGGRGRIKLAGRPRFLPSPSLPPKTKKHFVIDE